MGEQTFNIPDDNLEQHIITLFEKLECLRNSAKENDTGLGGRVPARLEVRTLSLWKAVVAECAASFLYVFIVCGAAGGAGVGASASAVLLSTALASGCAIATLTLCFANISGAHINPAVSAALCVRRRVSLLRTALYIAAQCGGAIAGAAAIYGVPGYAGSLSASLPGGGGAAWERLGAELVLSGLVAATYFAAMERKWTGAAPALLGAAYCAASFVSMPSLNPARSLGPSFVLSRWESHWVCWVGGIGGGIACALLHEWASRRPRPNSNSRASSPRDLDDLDKPAFPSHHHYRHAPTYCSASAPRPDNAEPLYSGTKSLYCRSPPPTRHTLHRSAGSTSHISQSVYSKASTTPGGGSLVAAQSLLLRPPTHPQHALTHNQNAHNAQRDPAYGITPNGVRPGPAGAAVQERRDSVYSSSTRRGPLSSDDSAYGTYSRAAYRAPSHPHPAPEHY
ncbi:neurogenic protein big brain isoform X2 [Hyposmocoma kahamanoa]|uniref:neurogenic protein big brain isoform X2 n=1 Tax=Hyposmocoma kahamanoa TaxID=1477025 RepID=UPI000E6D8996|nr:neurogenic protein big brain isoform X2 [Hyposmocoma kahamanoa]